MPENPVEKNLPAPESQKVSDRSNLSEKGPDDKSGTRSMHAVPPNRNPAQGHRIDEFRDEPMQSTESKGSGS
jgi:hypothetical protein